jgi:RNA polymerase sigma-70 factor (ECF subfamily)
LVLTYSHAGTELQVLNAGPEGTFASLSMGLFGEEVRIPIAMILTASMNPDTFSTQEDSIERLQRGELDALGSVMARYQHRLYRFLHRLLQDPIAADDVFQQTWLRVIEKIGRYDARRQFDAWLFSVARNLAIDYLRLRRSSSLDATDDSGIAPIERLEAAGQSQLDQLLECERGAALAAAVERLPLIHREVLSLRFEEDMKLEEIAEVAGIPISTVKSRLGRALESLRGRLEWK